MPATRTNTSWRLSPIGIFDLTGSADHSLSLADLRSIAACKGFNNSTAASPGRADSTDRLPITGRRHLLVITGHSVDSLTVGNGTWCPAGTVSVDGRFSALSSTHNVWMEPPSRPAAGAQAPSR